MYFLFMFFVTFCFVTIFSFTSQMLELAFFGLNWLSFVCFAQLGFVLLFYLLICWVLFCFALCMAILFCLALFCCFSCLLAWFCFSF